MKVGVPREIKNHEYRVGLVPASVHELTLRGHEVFVQTSAGHGIGEHDSDYKAAGAFQQFRQLLGLASEFRECAG